MGDLTPTPADSVTTMLILTRKIDQAIVIHDNIFVQSPGRGARPREAGHLRPGGDHRSPRRALRRRAPTATARNRHEEGSIAESVGFDAEISREELASGERGSAPASSWPRPSPVPLPWIRRSFGRSPATLLCALQRQRQRLTGIPPRRIDSCAASQHQRHFRPELSVRLRSASCLARCP